MSRNGDRKEMKFKYIIYKKLKYLIDRRKLRDYRNIWNVYLEDNYDTLSKKACSREINIVVNVGKKLFEQLSEFDKNKLKKTYNFKRMEYI